MKNRKGEGEERPFTKKREKILEARKDHGTNYKFFSFLVVFFLFF